MSKPSSPTRVTTRQMVALALGTLAALLLPVAAPASAAPAVNSGGGPAPVATMIEFDSLSTPTITVPDTPGAPASYIVQDTAFDVTLSFWGTDDSGVHAQLPLSTNKDVTVAVTGPGLSASVEVPAGATGASLTGLTLPTPADGVTLSAVASGHKTHASGTSPTFDVLIESTDGRSIGGNQTAAGCEATEVDPACADLIAPGSGFGTATLLSLGVCSTAAGGTGCVGNYVQALAGFAADVNDPATLVMKCDKSVCGGGAIHKVDLDVQLLPGGPTVTAEPCASKGVATPETGSDPFCVDYVQSTRDNAGDTHLFLLFTVDAKVRFP